MSNQNITDRADLRRWRIELPNMYDDADLDPFEFRLLAHYKRVGTCTESTATTAQKCHMSAGQVSKCRIRLADKGFIAMTAVKFHGGNAYSIEVVDMWEQNFAKYSASKTSTPSLSEVAPSPHEQAPSLSEQAPSLSEQAPSPHETKKEPYKKEQDKKERTRQKSTAGPLSNHPVIQMLREITNRYPPAGLHETLVIAIGDTPKEKLKEAREAWLLRGYNPNAYTWATDWAIRGIPGRGGNGLPRRPGGRPAPRIIP